MESFQAKEDVRKRYKSVRAAILPELRAKKSDKISVKFLDSKIYKISKNIMIYSSFGTEVSTKKIFERILCDKLFAILPKCDQKTKKITTFSVKSANNLKFGAYDILEPDENLCQIFNKNSIDLAVIPGLVFDSSGHRIGYGGGYYDRFLADFPGKIVGFCFRECYSERPFSSYLSADDLKFDVPVDDVILA